MQGVFKTHQWDSFALSDFKFIVRALQYTLLVFSFVTFVMGVHGPSLNSMFLGVFTLWMANVLFGCLDLRNRMLFLLIHLGIFLFLLTRPLIGTLDIHRTWMLSSVETTMFALGSMYLSMMALFLGAVFFEGIISHNKDRAQHRAMYEVKHPKQSYKKSAPLHMFSLLSDMTKEEKWNHIRRAAFICFMVCLAGSLVNGAITLSQMSGRAYEEYYLLDYSTPWIIGVLSPMMPYMLCAYLATMPRRLPSTICLGLYILTTVPMLMIGSRSAFVIAFLFAALYYIIRAITDKKERWISKRLLLIVAIAAPLGIFAMGMINYTRAGTDADMGFFALIADALFKQGVSFTVLGHGYDVNDQIQELGFRFFTIGSFISNITDGFIGQTFLNCPDLGSANSVLLALNGHSYAHTMSFFAHPNYLGGEGYGSSYILELFADFGYIGIAVGSFAISIALCALSRAIGSSWFGGMCALISAQSVFHMPRGYACEWISYIWTTRFLLAVFLLMACTTIFIYLSRVGTKPMPAFERLGTWHRSARMTRHGHVDVHPYCNMTDMREKKADIQATDDKRNEDAQASIVVNKRGIPVIDFRDRRKTNV